MSLQNISKSAVRVGKNYIKGYSDVQVKVRDATSNDPWGPSGTQMNELAQLSYNQYVSTPHHAAMSASAQILHKSRC